MGTVVVLLLVAIILMFVSIYYYEKDYRLNKACNQKGNNLSIVNSSIQKMFEILGSYKPSDLKLDEINKVIMKSFKPKYSSIVIYNGNEHIVKSTNVEECYIESIKEVANETIFSYNVLNKVSKYAIATEGKTVPYRSAIERDIKSAIFSPIYYNDVYLGFWIIEDTKQNAFDFISEMDLEKFKYNMGLFIENIQKQNAIEVAENIDKQTNFYNSNYLYSLARKSLIENDFSAITMIYLKNLPEINEKYTRNIGNTLISKISNIIRANLKEGSVVIRYSGLRFLIVNFGLTAQAVQPDIEKILSKMKKEYEMVEDEKVHIDYQIIIKTIKKQNNVEEEVQEMARKIAGIRTVNTIKVI